MVLGTKDKKKLLKISSESNLFQSKLFRRLFYTYVLIIFTCLVVYTSFVVYENYQINKIQIERKSEIQLDQVGNIVDQRMMNAQNIVQNLSYSSSLKQLYLSNKLGTVLQSYALYGIQNELKNTMASGGLSVYKTIIFLDSNDKAYSSGGVIWLEDVYQSENVEYPYLKVASLNDAFSFTSKRYSFQKECLLYCDAYTYQNGSEIGTICILFDLKQLQNDVKKVLQEGYAVRILYGDQELVKVGEMERGTCYSKESTQFAGVVYEVYASDDVKTEGNAFFYLVIVTILLISVLFVWLAFRASKTYYMPIDRLEQMVADVERPESGDNVVKDEMENIIEGIRNLIGEKNGYREKMLTIVPYVRTGMLHSMITGSMEKDTIRVFSNEDYLDLIKPYFITAVVNFSYEAGEGVKEEKHKQELKKLFKLMTESFSTDEVHIVYYFRDIYHAFIIINYDNAQPMDDLFYQIHKFLCVAAEKDRCMVTMGVDVQREDINELRDACEGAMKALDGILTDGRGEVYFLEQDNTRPNDYYFPSNFTERLKQYLEKCKKEELQQLMEEIYTKNWELGGSPEMYRSLIDELHLAVIKTLRVITELNTTHINVEKYRGLATLQEVFDYYSIALQSIADSLHEQTLQAEADARLEDEILEYIETNCHDANLSLQALSDSFKVSSKYLSLLCKKRYGITYLQYIQNKRIYKAAELLKTKKYSLSEVGTMCGYTNQLTFRRNFKSIMGINPSDYE